MIQNDNEYIFTIDNDSIRALVPFDLSDEECESIANDLDSRFEDFVSTWAKEWRVGHPNTDMSDSDFQWPNLAHNYDTIKRVNKFTDLHQITADEMWDRFDMHYNCVDTLPLYVSDDWNLIISPARDILSGLRWNDDDWDKCWGFEWAIHDDTDDTWDGFLAEYNLGSPWEAFRVALRYRDAFLAGDDDNYNAI